MFFHKGEETQWNMYQKTSFVLWECFFNALMPILDMCLDYFLIFSQCTWFTESLKLHIMSIIAISMNIRYFCYRRSVKRLEHNDLLNDYSPTLVSIDNRIIKEFWICVMKPLNRIHCQIHFSSDCLSCIKFLMDE